LTGARPLLALSTFALLALAGTASAAGIPTATFADFDAPASLHAGQSFSGKIDFENEGATQAARIVLSGLSPGALVTITPSKVQVRHGTQETSFSLRVSQAMPNEEIAGEVQILDARGNVIAAAPFFTKVTPRPGLFSRYWWALAVFVVALAAALLGIRARRLASVRSVRVNGLVAKLLDSGAEVSSLHAPLEGTAFPIEVVDDAGGPRLRPVVNGSATLTIRRSGSAITATGPKQPLKRFELDERIPIDERLELLVRDRLPPATATGTSRDDTLAVEPRHPS
jgi:hypothetical protein